MFINSSANIVKITDKLIKKVALDADVSDIPNTSQKKIADRTVNTDLIRDDIDLLIHITDPPY